MKIVIGAVVAILFVGAATQAGAATAGANLNISATIADSCSAIDATLAFGTINPTTGVVTPTTGLVNVTCTLATPFTVGLGDGLYATGGVRRMKKASASSYMNYSLYRDVLMTTRFGDTGSSDRASGAGLGLTATPISVYGVVPAGQAAPSGAYSDTVQITVYY